MAKRIKEWLLFLLPHALIIMGGMMLVFFIIDRVNHHVAFMTNEFHKWLAAAMSVCCLAWGLMQSEQNRKLFIARSRKKGKAGSRK